VKTLAYLCAVLVLAAGFASAEVIIDGFEDGDFFLLVTPTTGNDNDTQTGSSMIGGVRRVDILNVTTTGSGGNAQAEVASDNPDVLDNALSYSNSDQVTSTLKLTYGGTGNLLDADLSAEPFIDINLKSIDLATGMAVTLTSGMEGAGTSHTESDTASAPGFFPFTLADYATAGVDLSDIDEIIVTVSGDPALDLSIDLIAATDVIPEPATLSLLGIGLLAAAYRRRKRK